MKFVIAMLVALVALVGMTTAMVAPTTSTATAFLNTPLNVGVPTSQTSVTTASFSGLLTEGLMAAQVPTGKFYGTNLNGNYEGIDAPYAGRAYPEYAGDIAHPGQSTEFVAALES